MAKNQTRTLRQMEKESGPIATTALPKFTPATPSGPPVSFGQFQSGDIPGRVVKWGVTATPENFAEQAPPRVVSVKAHTRTFKPKPMGKPFKAPVMPKGNPGHPRNRGKA